MSAKVAKITEPPPVRAVVELLEDLLADARKGQIGAVAIGVVRRGGAAEIAISAGAPGTLMLGVCELLKGRIHDQIEGRA